MRQKGLDFGTPSAAAAPAAKRRRAWSVAELTDRLTGVVETEFADVWVEGEVSNLKIHGSGHWYFSLKDDRAQVRAVVWRSAARLIRFKPRDGLRVVARGAIRVYAARGEYQLQVELLEPLGKGALQQAFEELKARLQREGLFEAARKKKLPVLPRRVGLVTSPTGAVVRDFLRVLQRRYANLEVLIYPARVQGAESVPELVQGLRVLGGLGGLDVVVVARGGGSLEDLWAFNDEALARAIAACPLPTISAIGHETDFTIADFVADVRAPTPSAAAELVVQAKQDLQARVGAFEQRLNGRLRLRLAQVRHRVEAVTSHRVFEAERGRLRTYGERLLALDGRADLAVRSAASRWREQLRRAEERFAQLRWDRQLAARTERLAGIRARLAESAAAGLERRRAALRTEAGRLEALSPLGVLARGYALVWDAAGRRLVRHPDDVAVGERLAIRLHGGRLGATVTDKEAP